MSKGRFYVIEGTDASGKTTQFNLLAERFVKEGYDVVTFDFPQYDKDSSFFVREYLAGKYGQADEVGPYTSSVFYALDRYAAKDAIKEALDAGKIVLSNRFVGSNMAHQGTKFPKAEERRGFFIWEDNLEFQMLQIPRPTASIVLRVDAETSMQLIELRAEEEDRAKDIHEANKSHLERSVQVYDDLCALFPQDFVRIDCVRSNTLMTRHQVHDLVWSAVEKTGLPKPTKKKGSISSGDDNQKVLVKKTETGATVMTEAGKEFLKDAVTSTDSNVYAFTDQMSPITIAAAMARLSRRADDMRVTILDEFSGSTAKKDEALLKRVITAYGDDSVQQLVGQHVVVEGASNLLTKKLEWGRLASYLEQSTRYIFFDQKDEDGKYKYVIPSSITGTTRTKYVQIMDEIFEVYSDMVRSLTDYVRLNSNTPKEEQDVAWKGATRAQACGRPS